MSLYVRTLTTTAAILVSVATAAADPIQIRSGSLRWQPTEAVGVTLVGDGFTFAGGAPVHEGNFKPLQQCQVPECVPGTTVDLLAYFVDRAFGGTATLHGTTYRQTGLNSTSSLWTEWNGSLAIPGDFTGGTLYAPFTFSGGFMFSGDQTQPGGAVDLFGNGTAALTFSPYGTSFPGAFKLDAVDYSFGDVAATPEPASLILLGTGLCAIAAARRRRLHAQRN